MKEALVSLNKLLSDVKITKLNLKDAVIAKARVTEALSIVKKAQRASRPQDAEVAYKEAIKLTMDQAPHIYADKVADAVKKSTEYAYDQFLSPLLDVGWEDSLYEILPVGTGWSRGILVRLKMNEIAGDIGEYASAVQSARDKWKIKDGRDPKHASYWWRKKIYKGRRYFTTIRTRLEEANNPAPFWSLLNDGSINVKMSSDIGGTPYPARGGHHFVQQTEEAIRKFFNKTFAELRNSGGEDNPDFTYAISEAEKLLAELQSLIDKLSTDSELMQGIAKAVGTTVSKLNASKIIIAAERIKSGDIFTSRVVVGDGKRTRTATFIRLVNQFGGY